MYTLNCKGKLLALDRPVVMGIINITPDSFYQGHLHQHSAALVQIAGDMLRSGAGILDIGGQSTRPGSKPITAAEELNRVLPVIEDIHKNFPHAILSIDTYYSEVALAAVQAGAAIVNDISAGEIDKNMLDAVAQLQVPFIAMHMKGIPQTMQQHAIYNDVVKEVLDYFINKVAECHNRGIKDIILDPGFGFAKTIAHNFQLLQQLSVFSMLGKPVLAGLSRKSTIYKTLQLSAAAALNGTTCLNTIALLNGASILRVHDVKEAMEVVQLVQAYKGFPINSNGNN